jgi:tetratricopeptide (TPR) repeat protein
MTTEELATSAEQLEDEHAFDEAMERWRAVLQREQDPVYLWKYGMLAKKMKSWSEAESAFASAIDAAPNLSMGHELMALLLKDLGRYLDAKAYLQKSIEIEPTAERLTVLGYVQTRLGETTAARKSFRAALRIDPNYEEAYYNLGVTLRDDEITSALQLFEKAVELDSEYALAHRELGWSLRKLDRNRESEYHIRRAVELDDTDGWAHIYLGNLLWRKGDLPAAERAFLKAAEVWPGDSVPCWCLAMFYEYTDRPGEADFFYEGALQLNPDDPQANMRFGLYLKEIVETAKAKSYLERALELEPANERARQALAELS